MPALSLLSPLPPYPPHAGGTAHIFQATRQLSRFYAVSAYALADDPAQVTWGPMPEWCAEVHAFRRSRRRHGTIDPPAVQQDVSPALRAWLRARWRRTPPDVVQLEFTTMAQYADLAHDAGALVVCTAHNVAFLAQLRRARQERDLRMRARRFVGALSLWQYELRTLRRCDLVVALGEADAAALRRWLPRLPIVYLPAGIDLNTWPPRGDYGADDEVLFVGNYAHPPNVEGALWLVRAAWPHVRAARPTAQLTLAGRNPPPALQSYAAADINIPGTVADLHPLYQRAAVAVAPIFWGSGVRIKLIEALASGLPVVTTPLAAEGMRLIDGESALFATTPETFAAAILRLLADDALRARIGRAGRAVAVRDYDWASISRRLAGLYAGAQAGLRDRGG